MNKKITTGQVKDQVAKQVTKFYAEALGHGPKETRVYIVEDMIIVRLKEHLLPVEQKLLEGKEGIVLVKNIRKKLHVVLTTHLAAIVSGITGHKVITSHSDISTKTGELLEVFVLDTCYEKELDKSS